jgi:hypothetical protein
METLLKNEFTNHYGLPVSTVTNISVNTDAAYFEIEDDENREIQIHLTLGQGMAKYTNIRRQDITIINYDKFVTALPHAFQEGKKRCDLIVYTNAQPQHFLLNELKDRLPRPQVRVKAATQLLASLILLMDVPVIYSFAHAFRTKRCCYVNKQAFAPPSITATTAFNRNNAIVNNGLRMSHPAIEALGFEYYEYYGSQSYAIS